MIVNSSQSQLWLGDCHTNVILNKTVMEKATLLIKGKVAEVMENKGKLNAKVICDTDNLLISFENTDQIELGGEVTIEGEIKIKSIQVEGVKIS